MKWGRRQQTQSPIDDQLAEADIQDRLALANALRQKSMEGAQLDNVGGRLIGSPVARVLTGVAQGIQGAGEREKAQGMATDLATSRRERLAQALGGVGKDQTPDGMIEFGTRLLQDPATAEVGQFYIQSGQKAKDTAAAREAQEARWKHGDQVATDRYTNTEARAARQHQERMAQDAAQAAARAGGGADPFFTYQPITDEKGAITGIAKLDARGGPATRVEVPGLGFVQRPQDNPAVQQDLAGAKAMGKADADYWASRPAAKAARDSLMTDLKALRASPGFASIFGAVGGRVPNVMPAARDARAQLAKVVGGMSLKNRELLEGQGAVSNFEGELLAKAATILSDTSISDELAASEVDKILDDLQTGKYAPAAPSSAMPQQPSAPTAPPQGGAPTVPPPTGGAPRMRFDANGNPVQ